MNAILQKLLTLPSVFLLAWGWRRLAFCLLCGAGSALALPPYGLFPVLLLTFPAFVWLLDGALEEGASSYLKKMRTGFLLGWVFGFGYFLAGLWWIGAAFLVEADRFAWLMPFAVLAMPAGLAIFTGLAVGVAGVLWSDQRSRLLVLAACMTLADALRGTVLTGFPWNAFGYALSESLVLSQTASLVGLYGLTFLVWALFSVPALLADSRPLVGRLLPCFLAAGVIGVMAVFGGLRLWTAQDKSTELDIRIVQPSIDQRDKWRPELRGRIFQSYLDMTEAPLGGTARVGAPRLVVWPESSVPFLLTREPGALSRIAAALGPDTELALGAVRTEPGGAGPLYFNSIYLIGSSADVRGLYDKVRLVPFGEYVPLKSWMDRIGISNLAGPGAGFAAGLQRRTMTTSNGLRFLPLICYEAIFPSVTGGLENWPAFLLNVTNDAWFGRTAGPYQHFAQARMRSIETGLPGIRAANTGISAVFDGYGRVRAMMPVDRPGIIDAQLPVGLERTVYVKYRSSPVLVLSFFIVGFVIIRKYNQTSRIN